MLNGNGSGTCPICGSHGCLDEEAVARFTGRQHELFTGSLEIHVARCAGEGCRILFRVPSGEFFGDETELAKAWGRLFEVQEREKIRRLRNAA